MRRVTDSVFWGLCGLAFALIMVPSIWVLISIFHQAWPALNLSLITKSTANNAGIRNAILGTLMLLFGVLIVAGTIGVSAGFYLAEFASKQSRGVLRFGSEVLAGLPSILIGYVGYTALVVGLHWQPSLLAAVLALSVIVVPYVVKTTEVALSSVPTTLREGSAALGLPRSVMLRRVLLPPALPGIVSGLVIALAISTGELAPLLFTAGSSDFNPTFQLTHHPLNYLTQVTYTATLEPGARYHEIAAAAAAVTLVMLLILIAAGRLLSARARRVTHRMQT